MNKFKQIKNWTLIPSDELTHLKKLLDEAENSLTKQVKDSSKLVGANRECQIELANYKAKSEELKRMLKKFLNNL